MQLSRRRFLVDGLRVSALVPSALHLDWTRSVDEGASVLVVLQLTGGNDGLNTLVPHRQDGYWRLRPTLALKRSALLALDDEHGLHPSLRPLESLVAEGRFAAVHGVGVPHPDRSHFRSLEIWHTGDPENPPRIGWLGRLADQIVRACPGSMPALHVGEEDLPLALVGEESFAPSIQDEHSLELAALPGLAAERARLVQPGAKPGSDFAFLRDAARDAYAASERLERTLASSSSGDYPDYVLARKLRLVARLVAGGLGTRLFHVSLGGFDTHARQAAAHTALLEELARSLAAFQRDLSAHDCAQRVVTLIHSEFGRRVEENGSRGTDHGAAAPVFLAGERLRQRTFGTPPALEHLVEGDVPCTTDLRALYAALEHDWLGLAPSSAFSPLTLWA
jgi:uncharacterized protein (DUF1501 family)